MPWMLQNTGDGCGFFSRRRFILLQINKKYLQKKRKTDISNTVRKIVEKQKQQVWQP